MKSTVLALGTIPRTEDILNWFGMNAQVMELCGNLKEEISRGKIMGRRQLLEGLCY